MFAITDALKKRKKKKENNTFYYYYYVTFALLCGFPMNVNNVFYKW